MATNTKTVVVIEGDDTGSEGVPVRPRSITFVGDEKPMRTFLGRCDRSLL